MDYKTIKEIEISMSFVMSKYDNKRMLKLIVDLIEAQSAENFASFRFNVNNKSSGYYIVAGKSNGASIQEKYDESQTKLQSAQKEIARLKKENLTLRGCSYSPDKVLYYENKISGLENELSKAVELLENASAEPEWSDSCKAFLSRHK